VAKLWTVYPKLWRRPLFASPAHAVERLSLVPLVGGSLMLVVGGMNDSMYVLVNPFTFTPTHYLFAWITVGALVVHVTARRKVTLQSLRRPVPTPGTDTPADTPADGTERRRFLTTVGIAAGVVGVNYLASNVSPLHSIALLPARRADVSLQRLPVQTLAKAAGVVERATSSAYRLRVVGRVGRPLELSMSDLRALVGHTAYLPISCVQGWSVGALWRGVPVRDLLHAAGVRDFDDVVVTSIQIATRPMRMFGQTRLSHAFAMHPDTMLAMELNGARLHIDHGYPVRLIAPNRPGIMCPKWVEEVRVR